MADSERVETVVIGAGQAGLSVGYHLGRRGRPAVILDAHPRVGDNWRRHWDTLRLYSPARYDGLPGMAFPAPSWTFPGKDQVADYLEQYANHFELDVRSGVRVGRLSKAGDRFLVDCGDQMFEADNVVVATGTFGTVAYRPDFSAELDPGIVQLHSADYHNPSQLQPGPVLVVGASHSGADVAFEVAATHATVLSGRSNGQLPFNIEGRPAHAAFPVLWFMARRVLTLRTPIGRKFRAEVRVHGGPLLRVKAEDLAESGVEWVRERTVGVRDGRPVLDGGRVLDVANVVWCTGFRQDFGWIDLPVTGEDGWPLETRGVIDSQPGLYFTGLAFQRSFSSMLVGGAGKDAEYVAKHLVRRQPKRARTTKPTEAAA
ncbi:MAG: flavin-containing monooxygenase [Nocardioidaceae bacterium]